MDKERGEKGKDQRVETPWYDEYTKEPERPSSASLEERRKLMGEFTPKIGVTQGKASHYAERLLDPNTRWDQMMVPSKSETNWMRLVYPLIWGQDVKEMQAAIASCYEKRAGEGDSGKESTTTTTTGGPEKETEQEGGNELDKILDNEEDLSVVMAEACRLHEEITEYALDDRKKVNKEWCRFFLPKLQRLKALLDRELIRNAQMKGVIKGMMYEGATSTTEKAKGPSKRFSDVVKEQRKEFKPITVKEKRVVPKKTIILYPKNEEQKSEVTREALKSLDPVKEQLRVKNVRPVGKGGVLIEAADDSTLMKLRNAEKFKELGIRVETPKLRGPKVIIYDVPRESDNDTFVNKMLGQNFPDEAEDLKAEVTVRARTGPRSNVQKVNLILEVSSRVRRMLVDRERLFVGFNCCRARDYVVPMRCFKCLQFGHTKRFCKGHMTCGHCGDAGHKFSECQRKTEVVKCANCVAEKRSEYNHRVDSSECPIYQKALAREIDRIDYG